MFSLRNSILLMAGEIEEDERRRREHRNFRRSRRLLRDNSILTNYSEASLIKSFRFGGETLKNLKNELGPLLPQRRRNDGLTPEMKVLIALAFYATGSYQTLVGQSVLHSVSQPSVSRAVSQVTEALNTAAIFHKYVRRPTHREERISIKAKFYQRFHIPSVLGCIDGTHVAILRPTIHEERYYNRKGYHSLNVMIITDSDLNILWVYSANPGSAHDSRVWSGHPLCHQLTQLCEAWEQVFLLGGSGYPLRKTLMTPILNTTEGTKEHHYYKKHVVARNTVERCIGVLKARFRCLLVARSLHYDPAVAGKIVNACCVLHNIANSTGTPLANQLTTEEANAEALRLQHNEDDIAAEAEQLLEVQMHSRVNRELIEGRAVQQALIEKLWRERENN